MVPMVPLDMDSCYGLADWLRFIGQERPGHDEQRTPHGEGIREPARDTVVFPFSQGLGGSPLFFPDPLVPAPPPDPADRAGEGEGRVDDGLPVHVDPVAAAPRDPPLADQRGLLRL